MTQRDLNLSVACATGESLGDIRRRGFSLADPLDVNFDPEPSGPFARCVDWDDVYPTDQSVRPRRRNRKPR